MKLTRALLPPPLFLRGSLPSKLPLRNGSNRPVVQAIRSEAGRDLDNKAIMGRLPEPIEGTEALRTKELVVPLPMHDELKSNRLQKTASETMNRNVLYLIIGALVAVAAVLGYQLYQERQKTTGIEINIGKGGISIEKK
jgi:hypothetical protein